MKKERFPMLVLVLVSIFTTRAAAQATGGKELPLARQLQMQHPKERAALNGWETALRALAAQTREQNPDAETILTTTAILKLLDAPRLPISGDKELLGAWKVRSLQVSSLGAYNYPFFKCTIQREEDRLLFHKNTGSQRRRGLMNRDSQEAYYFLGAEYYGYEQPRSYRSPSDGASEEDLARNTSGLLFKIGTDHYVFAFTPQGTRGEVYEMIK